MFKLSSKVIDYYDNNIFIGELINKDAPDFVKQAQLMTEETAKMVPDDMYAVIMMTKTGARHKKYPITDKAHVWLSCAAFNKTASSIPAKAAIVAATNLKASCELFDMPVPSYISKIAASNITWNKVRIDESIDMPLEAHVPAPKPSHIKYAMNIETKDGVINKFPLDNKFNVKAAIKYFKKNIGKIPGNAVVSFAKNIEEAANKFGVSIPPFLAKAATNKTGTKAAMNIRSRANYTGDRKAKATIKELAKKSKDMTATKTASYLESIDESLGIARKYNRGLSSPMEAVLENFVKEAIDTETQTSRRGSDIFSKEDIEVYASTKSDELENFLPSSLIDSFKMDPAGAFDKMTDIQKQIIKDGISGEL